VGKSGPVFKLFCAVERRRGKAVCWRQAEHQESLLMATLLSGHPVSVGMAARAAGSAASLG